MSDTYTRSVISFSLKMGHFTSLKRKYLKELARIMYKGKSAKINL